MKTPSRIILVVTNKVPQRVLGRNRLLDVDGLITGGIVDPPIDPPVEPTPEPTIGTATIGSDFVIQ